MTDAWAPVRGEWAGARLWVLHRAEWGRLSCRSDDDERNFKHWLAQSGTLEPLI